MDYEQRWQIIREIDGGGQGRVSEVFDKTRFNIGSDLQPSLQRAMGGLTSIQQDFNFYFNLFRQTLSKLIELENPYNHGALKVLHLPEQARDAKLAEERLKREIQAMREISHPNLLKITDADTDSRWFVSQYYPKGTLSENRKFIGKPLQALIALRPIVEGVAQLHKEKKVHRDIKPQNIFLDEQDNLILGDFGLVFNNFEPNTRISDTFQNVGSRDWMPQWATTIRIEDIKPCHDIFSLGKVLWAMISTTPLLQLWYHRESQFNLEKMFPTNNAMKSVNTLLDKCIVQHEKDCIENAAIFLEEIDALISLLESGGDTFDPKANRKCKVCGVGDYKDVVHNSPGEVINFGLSPLGDRTFKIFSCSNCGNVQLFYFFRGQKLNAWND